MQVKANIKCIFSSYEIGEVLFCFGDQAAPWFARDQWNTQFKDFHLLPFLSTLTFILYNHARDNDADARNKHLLSNQCLFWSPEQQQN